MALVLHQTLPAFFLLLLLSVEVHSKVPAIIVFGDSTVDAGNNNQIPTVLKSNFAPYGRDFAGGKPTGRFSNGRIATDFISEAFGIKPVVPAYLDPMYSIKDFATGVTFASAGTGLDKKTSSIVSVIPLWKEIEFFKDYKKQLTAFLGKTRAAEIIREAVYIISIGTNDFILNYFLIPGGRSSQFTIEEYENFLGEIAESLVIELYRLGARKISLGGLPPIGCLPVIRTLTPGHFCLEELNNLAINFDRKAKQSVVKLRQELQGIRVVFSNVYYLALDVIEKPYLYGMENVANGCCGSGRFELGPLCHQSNPLTCNDANKYAFWDAVHPTEKLNFLAADHLMKTSLAEFL